ncbi:MAG: Na+/H+ antiporter NhaA [Candidatus Obscuribacterales bacterium]|nr:Na+/H+ antiporter NhaA [Candidatus Obscuribacterales bacterium]
MAQLPGTKTRNPPLVSRLRTPFEEFVQNESFTGFLLLAAAAAALLWANSPAGSWYFALRDTQVNLSVAGWNVHSTLQHIINDGLMALFFFVVGLEIKRELLVGELNSLKQAALPVAAAVGGMVVPALIFTLFNYSTTTASGWAIPMATDIAFALGILAVVGGWRVPLSARIFLTSLAIIDDLGAVLIIALFYSNQIDLQKIALATVFCILLAVMNRIGIRSALVYGTVGFLVWLSLLGSGVHATIAGILVAAAIPVISRIDSEKFQQITEIKLRQFATATETTRTPLIDNDQEKAIHELRSTLNQVEPPMFRLQHSLHPWSIYFIMPAFAFFNAGIELKASSMSLTPLATGIFMGLVIGKPTGILLFSWLSIKLGWAMNPQLPLMQFIGLSFLAGIGFTMSLFIANLAFEDRALIDSSTTAIIAASLASACLGAVLLNRGKSASNDA